MNFKMSIKEIINMVEDDTIFYPYANNQNTFVEFDYNDNRLKITDNGEIKYCETVELKTYTD